jgi:DNA repair exonuclease SbcCD ATPase subunit
MTIAPTLHTSQTEANGLGSGAPFGLRRVSRRREEKAVQIHGAMSKVSEQLLAVPKLNSPAALTRKSISLKLPRTAPDASTDGETASSANDPEVRASSVASSTEEQLEDLRLQNAVLRKSLAMLQQSIVDSMKGNKGGFQGSGIFRRANSQDRPPRMPEGTASSSPQPNGLEADLESFRTALVEKRAALRDALKERDDALAEVELAKRQAAQFSSQLDTLQQELLRVQQQLAASEVVRQEAESDRRDAHSRLEGLTSDVASLRESLAKAEAVSVSLQDELRKVKELASSKITAEAALSTQLEKESLLRKELESKLAFVEQRAAADRAQLVRLCDHRQVYARRSLAGALCGVVGFGAEVQRVSTPSSLDGSSFNWEAVASTCRLRVCFEAWLAFSSVTREERLRSRIEELQKEKESLNSALDLAQKAAASSQQRADDAQTAATEATELLKAQQLSSDQQIELVQKKLAEALARADALTAELVANSEASSEHRRCDDEFSAELRAKVAVLEAQLAEALQRQQALEAELQRTLDALEVARQTEIATSKQRDEAVERSKQLEEKRAITATSLEAAQANLLKAQKEAKDAQTKMTEANSQAQKLQARATELEAKVAALESRAATACEAARSAETKLAASEKAGAQNAANAKEEADQLRFQKATLEEKFAALQSALQEVGGADAAKLRKAAEAERASLVSELSQLKSSLAEARSDAKSATEKLKVLREEKTATAKALEAERSVRSTLEREREEELQKRPNFAEEVKKALDEARQNIRIMVTAPKVCVNVGGNTLDLTVPFPFQAIRDTVQSEVMPRYSRIFAVADTIGDQELRQGVQEMVEQLASTLQTKVYELMPQAEGTCNWDGFGAKVGKLGAGR